MSESVFKKIPIKNLVPDNIREIDPEFVKGLVGLIKENGLETNLEVYEHPTEDGKYKVFDGHNRLSALLKLNSEDAAFWSEVPCYVRKTPRDNLELRLHQLVANLARDSFSASDIAKNIRLFRNLGLNEEQISARLGKTSTWVKTHLRLHDDGCLALKEANRKKQITNTATQHLSALDTKTQEKWVKKIIKAKEKAKGKREASRAEADLVAKAFRVDAPKGEKAYLSFPKPMKKKDLAKIMADMHDMHTSYIKGMKLPSPREIESHEPRLEAAMRGIALVFGAGTDAVLDDSFDYTKWFSETFGAGIDDDKWFI